MPLTVSVGTDATAPKVVAAVPVNVVALAVALTPDCADTKLMAAAICTALLDACPGLAPMLLKPTWIPLSV